jgi:N-acetyl-D-muramate 6-phosphate phosphatase
MPLDVARIRGLCFDIDGTLSNTDDYQVAELAALLRRLRFVRNPDRNARRLIMWVESPANGLLGLADTLGVDKAAIGLIEWIYRSRTKRGPDMPLVPGVQDLLVALRDRFRLAIVSARDERSAKDFLEQAGLARYFDTVVTALSAEHTKPYPDPIRLAAHAMGVPAESCVMIGDTTVDIRAGKAAGAQTVGVLCGYGEEPELRRQGADLILPGTADLREVLVGEAD